MKTMIASLCLALLVAGCGTMEPTDGMTRSQSPTQALVRGEITADQYLDAVTAANQEARANEQFEVNKEPTRAYNTRTGRIEYVPEGTVQKWNEETQRWEFTPVER
ncbi:MAG: hypothetical protein ACP5I4_05725 [Oceanipulchritudo sp.]